MLKAFRIDGKSYPISASASVKKHPHELYHVEGPANKPKEMVFSGKVADSAQVSEVEQVAKAAAGAEAAEEQLKRSLQRLQQEKESRK